MYLKRNLYVLEAFTFYHLFRGSVVPDQKSPTEKYICPVLDPNAQFSSERYRSIFLSDLKLNHKTHFHSFRSTIIELTANIFCNSKFLYPGEHRTIHFLQINKKP